MEINTIWLKIVLGFILVALPARCVGGWKTERDNVAYVEERSAPQIEPIIPDCAQVGQRVYFQADDRGLIRYWCGG